MKKNVTSYQFRRGIQRRKKRSMKAELKRRRKQRKRRA